MCIPTYNVSTFNSALRYGQAGCETNWAFRLCYLLLPRLRSLSAHNEKQVCKYVFWSHSSMTLAVIHLITELFVPSSNLLVTRFGSFIAGPAPITARGPVE